MNYSKNINKAEIAKRLFVSWVVVATAFFVIGGILGYTLQSYISMKDKYNGEMQTSQQIQSEFVVYGAYDDQVLTQEISLDWEAGDLDFVPLQCDVSYEEQEFLFYLCSGYNIDFCLVMAVIQTESEFDTDAVSVTGDYGLMQINEMNHDWLTESIGVTDYLDPYQNMRAGCYIFRKLFERYQDTELVLMAYKMGENGASRLWKHGIFFTDYTEKVLNWQYIFQKQLEGDGIE